MTGSDGQIKKTCSKCGEEKDAEDFFRDKRMKLGLSSWCRSCTSAGARRWREENPEKARESSIAAIRKCRYGVTRKDYNLMLYWQRGKCAACGMDTKKFHIDHNHKTNTVRGLLCHRCNIGLGFIEDAELHDNAVGYLRLWSENFPENANTVTARELER